MKLYASSAVMIVLSLSLSPQKCLQFELDETVWEAKQRILSIFSKVR